LPSALSFLFEFLGLCEDGGHGTGDDSHAVARVVRVRVKVNSSHRVCFARRGLTISKDGAVETLYETGDEGLGGRSIKSMLRGSLTMNLVEIKRLFLCWCSGDEGLGSLRWGADGGIHGDLSGC
jgi:hypothetical protein